MKELKTKEGIIKSIEQQLPIANLKSVTNKLGTYEFSLAYKQPEEEIVRLGFEVKVPFKQEFLKFEEEALDLIEYLESEPKIVSFKTKR